MSRWPQVQDALLARRDVAVFSALALVLVPTLFSIFPVWGQWSLTARIPIVIAWFCAAAVVAFTTTWQSEQVASLVGAALARQQRQRRAAARLLIEKLLADPPGFPTHYQFRLFLYDEDLGRLLPAYEPDGVERSEGWAPGQGATGNAYRSGRPVVVRGTETHDGTYGLTADQQARYADLSVVAAMPIVTARNEVIGVLSGSSRLDDGALAGPDGQDRHEVLATTVGRVLIDVLRLARD